MWHRVASFSITQKEFRWTDSDHSRSHWTEHENIDQCTRRWWVYSCTCRTWSTSFALELHNSPPTIVFNAFRPASNKDRHYASSVHLWRVSSWCAERIKGPDVNMYSIGGLSHFDCSNLLLYGYVQCGWRWSSILTCSVSQQKEWNVSAALEQCNADSSLPRWQWEWIQMNAV